MSGIQPTQRRCSRCKETLDISRFSRRKRRGKDGFHYWCKSCNSEYILQKRREAGVPPLNWVELDITRLPDGNEGLKCKHCGVTKLLIDMCTRRGRPYRVCKSCNNKRRRGQERERNIAKLPNLQDEERRNHAKEVSKMSFIQANRRLRYSFYQKEIREQMQ